MRQGLLEEVVQQAALPDCHVAGDGHEEVAFKSFGVGQALLCPLFL